MTNVWRGHFQRAEMLVRRYEQGVSYLPEEVERKMTAGTRLGAIPEVRLKLALPVIREKEASWHEIANVPLLSFRMGAVIDEEGDARSSFQLNKKFSPRKRITMAATALGATARAIVVESTLGKSEEYGQIAHPQPSRSRSPFSCDTIPSRRATE